MQKFLITFMLLAFTVLYPIKIVYQTVDANTIKKQPTVKQNLEDDEYLMMNDRKYFWDDNKLVDR